jgi:hypothetical protein
MSTNPCGAYTGSIPAWAPAYTGGRDGVIMNATQITHRTIAAAILAVSTGLALASCAGQQSPEPVSKPLSAVQVAQLQAGQLELAESRAEMYRDLAAVRADEIAEQQAGHLELAESRAAMSRDLAAARSGGYVDQAERRGRIE